MESPIAAMLPTGVGDGVLVAPAQPLAARIRPSNAATAADSRRRLDINVDLPTRTLRLCRPRRCPFKESARAEWDLKLSRAGLAPMGLTWDGVAARRRRRVRGG